MKRCRAMMRFGDNGVSDLAAGQFRRRCWSATRIAQCDIARWKRVTWRRGSQNRMGRFRPSETAGDLIAWLGLTLMASAFLMLTMTREPTLHRTSFPYHKK